MIKFNKQTYKPSTEDTPLIEYAKGVAGGILLFVCFVIIYYAGAL
jgi:hypothetical protein